MPTDARKAMERALEVLKWVRGGFEGAAATATHQKMYGDNHAARISAGLSATIIDGSLSQINEAISLLTAALAALDKERALTELVELGQEIDAALAAMPAEPAVRLDEGERFAADDRRRQDERRDKEYRDYGDR